MAEFACSAGRLRERIRFDRREVDVDGLGNPGDWQPLCGPFSARLRPINGKEVVLAGKLAGVQPYEIVVRFCVATAAVTPADRAVDVRTGRTFNITAVQDPTERRQWLSMLVKAGDAET
jgi:SPP1 family predicted phage head-tail adaptor